MSTLRGKIADRASIMKSGFSDFEKAVIKATKHNTKPPKEKHVRRLMMYTSEYSGRTAELINLLAKRLDILDWIVVLKTLCVYHRLMRDGNSRFMNDLKHRSSVFNLRRFSDKASAEAHNQSIFIRKYSQYLEEKVVVFKMMNAELDKDPAAIKSLTVDEAIEKIPRLQSQINAMLNSRGSKDYINNNIIVYAFTLLLKDSFPLYRALNDGIIILLEHYFTMSRENAIKSLEMYKLFTKETDGMIQFFEITKRFSRAELPKLQNAPTSLIDALENYIKDLDDGKQGKSYGKDSRSAIKFTQNQMENFKFDGTQLPNEEEEESESDDEDLSDSHYKTTAQSAQSSKPIIDFFDDDNNYSNGNVNLASGQETTFGDPFASSRPTSSSDFGSYPIDKPTFDPFGQQGNNTAVQYGQAPNQEQAYLEKKKQIEMMFAAPQSGTQNPLVALQSPSMPASPVLARNNNTSSPSFPSNTYPTTVASTGYGYAPNQAVYATTQPQYASNQQPQYAPNQQQHTYQQPQYAANQQPTFAPTTQQQPAFAPNPFAANPFQGQVNANPAPFQANPFAQQQQQQQQQTSYNPFA